jgi:predicted nucleotidyltransferase
MPVRSSSSSVVAWPDARSVGRALREWAEAAARSRPEVRRVGYFGSYARGDWGVGSDVDVVIVVASSPTTFSRRAAEWDLTRLPVPADVLVFTEAEWREALESTRRFARVARDEVVWVYDRAAPIAPD